MRKYLPFLLTGLLCSCAENAKKPLPDADSSLTVYEQSASSTFSPLPDKIISERTNGSVTLLDTIDGKPLVSLNDNVLLDATMPKNGWSETSIEVAVSAAQEKNMIIKKGQTLTLAGKVVGKALDDLHLATTGENMQKELTGYFFGYIRKKDIKPGSVIETALAEFLHTHSGRLLPDMQPFIKQFQLENTVVNAPFLEYYNYDNTVDDPSPLYRIVLVFYKNTLIGAVAARPLALGNAKAQSLERGFTGYFFPDTDQKVIDEYVKLFNTFITNVD
ncbi:hypothetical protein [Chitinophaga sancti]|uniref:Uncharacterized protein n=1 Tax=Chitinophaga sancti TaxID=1004 RepID=A0A1K1MP76_9BACT|nr:hypothetical protein [Chitinophaga sancti]WQD62859.1 hypothetical protein U0033_00525 [Chitinophaga sancti]WQG91517.1 hypothetical protein SR876_08390 [Chitinophaga sancti]SFW24972.1 hypothetical protein SAMN05661012_00755 [Chitinophaga sancti]